MNYIWPWKIIIIYIGPISNIAAYLVRLFFLLLPAPPHPSLRLLFLLLFLHAAVDFNTSLSRAAEPLAVDAFPASPSSKVGWVFVIFRLSACPSTQSFRTLATPGLGTNYYCLQFKPRNCTNNAQMHDSSTFFPSSTPMHNISPSLPPQWYYFYIYSLFYSHEWSLTRRTSKKIITILLLCNWSWKKSSSSRRQQPAGAYLPWLLTWEVSFTLVGKLGYTLVSPVLLAIIIQNRRPGRIICPWYNSLHVSGHYQQRLAWRGPFAPITTSPFSFISTSSPLRISNVP